MWNSAKVSVSHQLHDGLGWEAMRKMHNELLEREEIDRPQTAELFAMLSSPIAWILQPQFRGETFFFSGCVRFFLLLSPLVSSLSGAYTLLSHTDARRGLPQLRFGLRRRV